MDEPDDPVRGAVGTALDAFFLVFAESGKGI